MAPPITDTIHIQAGSYTGDVDTTASGKNVILSPGVGTAQVTNHGSLTLDAGGTTSRPLLRGRTKR